MAEKLDDLIFDVKGNLRPLENDLRQAEAKMKAAKDKVERSGILLKVGIDFKAAERDLDAFVRRATSKLALKGTVTLDTTNAERQISSLQSKMGQIGGGFSGAGGSVVGSAVGSYLGARSGSSGVTSNVSNFTTNTYKGNHAPQQIANFGVGGLQSIAATAGKNIGFAGDIDYHLQGISPKARLAYQSFVSNIDAINAFTEHGGIHEPDAVARGMGSADPRRRGMAINPLAEFASGRIRGEHGPLMRNGAFARPSVGRLGSRLNNMTGAAGGMGGMAMGVGAGLAGVYAASQYLGDVGSVQGNVAANAFDMRRGQVFDPDSIYQAGLAQEGKFMQYYGNLPVMGGIGRGLNSWMNGGRLASAQAQDRVSTHNRDKRLSRNDSYAAAFANNLGANASLITNPFDRITADGEVAASAIDAQINARGTAAMGGGPAFTEKERQSMVTQRNAITTNASRQRAMAVNAHNLQLGQLNMAGVDDRGAARMGIMGQYGAGLNMASQLMNAALGAEARGYNRDTGFMNQGNNVAALAGGGYNLAATLAGNKLGMDQALVGVTDPARRGAIQDSRAIADKSAVIEFNISLKEMAGNVKAAAQALGGNSLQSALTGIENSRQAALARNPEMAGALNSQFDMAAAGAKVDFGKGMAAFGLGTKGINLSTRRQEMMNSGNYIKSQVQGIIDETGLEISRVNLEMQGNDPQTVKAREARIKAIQRNAEARVEGVQSELRFSTSAQQVGAYAIAGGAGGRSPLALKAMQDIAGIGGQMAAGQKDWAGANGPPNVGNPAGANGAMTDAQVKAITDWLQKIAENVGVQ